VAVGGFGRGGGWKCDYATANSKFKTVYSYYGNALDDPAKIAKIPCPVYGFYGENDERVNATIPKAEELMKAACKKYEPVIYKGAGHGFMRSGEPNNPNVREGDRQARDEAWARWKTLLRQLLDAKLSAHFGCGRCRAASRLRRSSSGRRAVRKSHIEGRC